MPGCRMRLFWALLLLLVSVPRLCHQLASSVSFCSAPRPKCWSASRRFRSASTALPCLYSQVSLILLQRFCFLFSRVLCNVCIPWSFLSVSTFQITVSACLRACGP